VRLRLIECSRLSVPVGSILAIAGIVAAWLALSMPANAETVESALAAAYLNNPQLNAQRAVVRETDEQVPQALSGYRPHVNGTATVGVQSTSSTSQILPQATGAPAQYLTNSGYNAPYSAGITVVQNLYNGNQTANRTRAAESQVSAARATLRNAEQTILLNALTDYMNVLRDYAILQLQLRNVTVLEQELHQTRDRFKLGDVTATDINQAESRLGGGQTQVLNAQANYDASVAAYQQVIGHSPGKLSPGSPVDRLCPATLEQAFALIDQHPSVVVAMYTVDYAQLLVKVAEGQLMPSFNLQASAQKAWEQQLDVPQASSISAIGQLSVPIYQGGAEHAVVRQQKETLGQRLLELGLARNQVRQAIAQTWSQVLATKSAIKTTQIQVQAAEKALNGVREEALVGQRTTLDVLNAQQELVSARVAVVTAERDRVVASYTLLGAAGRLSPEILGLQVDTYDASVHYHQVRDNWYGLRTPDGR
jgi:outer membrane protein